MGSREREERCRGRGGVRGTRRRVGAAVGSRRWPGRVAARAGRVPVLLAGRKTTGEAQMGWAAQELGQALVGCTVRPGNFLLSLSFSNYLSFLLFCKFRALLKILRHFQKS